MLCVCFFFFYEIDLQSSNISLNKLNNWCWYVSIVKCWIGEIKLNLPCANHKFDMKRWQKCHKIIMLDFSFIFLVHKILKYYDFHNGYKTMKYTLDSTIDIFPNKKIPLLEFVPCNLQWIIDVRGRYNLFHSQLYRWA